MQLWANCTQQHNDQINVKEHNSLASTRACASEKVVIYLSYIIVYIVAIGSHLILQYSYDNQVTLHTRGIKESGIISIQCMNQ